MLNYPNTDKNTIKKRHQINDVSYQAKLYNHIDLSSFYTSSDLETEYVEVCNDRISVYLKSNLAYGKCPYCGTSSKKVHSYYMRRLVDLSIMGKPVELCLYVRKFFCSNLECNKKTFAEQPGNEIFRYRRRTRRCELQVLHHGLVLPSSKASELLNSCGIGISNSTVLRDIHRVNIPNTPHVSEIGVDDWAFRKGITYGSIIVDLKTHNVIDLLGDRKKDSFKAWLHDHPEVNVVSRDRSTEYSSAISSIDKNIIEVADRFHLVKNMSDCIYKLISENYHDYRELVRSSISSLEIEDTSNLLPQDKSYQINKKEDIRMVKFNEVKELQAKGLKETRIAKTLGIARQTTKKYMNYQILPPRKSKERNQYYKFDDYVETRHQEGISLQKILKDIKEQGFKGSRTPFYDHYKYLNSINSQANISNKKKVTDIREPIIPIRQLAQIVDKSIRNPDFVSIEENHLIKKLFSLKWFKIIFAAGTSFYNLFKNYDTKDLDIWIHKYENSAIGKLRTFVYGIKRDIDAVKNAIISPISNGVVEGFVNKLKMVKRTLFGRAKLHLLKKKMVLPDLIFN